jgi:predicted RNA methylase
MGAGKGRVILLASELPFRRVLGVEFAPALVDIAQQNIAHYSRRVCTNTAVACQDATELELPDENLVVYFYNPFSHDIMAAVAQRILEAYQNYGKKIIVIYHIAPYRDVLENLGIFNARQSFRKTAIYYSR